MENGNLTPAKVKPERFFACFLSLQKEKMETVVFPSHSQADKILLSKSGNFTPVRMSAQS